MKSSGDVNLETMGYTHVGVRPQDKVLGVVKRDSPAKPWSVMWPDSSEYVSIDYKDVAILGSQKFYKLVDDSINKRHFLEDPVYFTESYLVQNELSQIQHVKLEDSSQPPKKQMSSTDFKKKLLELGVGDEKEINTAWKKVLPHYTDVEGTLRFKVKKPETFTFRVEAPWNDFDAKPAKDTKAKSGKSIDKDLQWISTLVELTFASNGQEMGSTYETRAKMFWPFLFGIDETKLTQKELKALSDQGSPATKLLVRALNFLTGQLNSRDVEDLWKFGMTLPAGDRRQYAKLVDLLIACGAEPKSKKDLIQFTIDLIADTTVELVSTKKALSEYCAQLIIDDAKLLSHFSDHQLWSLENNCNWKNPWRAELLAIHLKRNPKLTDLGDIFVGIEKDSLVSLTDSDLFRLLSGRNQLAASIRGYLDTFFAVASSPAELFGLLKVSSAAPTAIDPETIRLATSKAFLGNPTFEVAWETISGTKRIQNLESRLKELDSRLAAKEAEVQKTTSELIAAKEYAGSLNVQLAKAIDAAHQSSGATTDAARLDAARAVAALAASIYDSAISGKTEVLSMLRPTISRLGLVATGEPGQELRFDPERHMDPSGVLKSGDEGILKTPGFTTSVGSETAVLRKAIVSER